MQFYQGWVRSQNWDKKAIRYDKKRFDIDTIW